MQPTNQPKQQKSRCAYCGSADYGRGCRFGPHGRHYHADNTLKCGYCGSASYGRGCKLNPIGDLHVRGGVFNNMYKESVQSFLDNSILLRELKKDFTQFPAYKLGIIDENGNKLKNPITEQEQSTFTPFVRTIIKLKKYLGSKIELMEAGSLLEHNSIPFTEDIVKYKKVLEYQDRVETIVNELYKTLDEAQQEGLSLEDIKKLVKA